MIQQSSSRAKPFLKWAGGKGKLLEKMRGFLPTELKEGQIQRYIEPFIGGGAVFIDLAQRYQIEELYIFDVNPELILAYKTIQKDVDSLINLLTEIQKTYLALDEENKKRYYYRIRETINNTQKNVDFNTYSLAWIERTASLIFLNKTCFNGLFRVNSQGKFNVPMGRYKKPLICHAENLIALSKILQQTNIQLGDFSDCEKWINSESFVYFDPPYKPISQTASFTAYSQHFFDDSEQLRLREFFVKLDKIGAKLMLSNSDPKNEDNNNNFFEEAYQGYNIQRIKAGRSINSNANKRGDINELLIMNYEI